MLLLFFSFFFIVLAHLEAKKDIFNVVKFKAPTFCTNWTAHIFGLNYDVRIRVLQVHAQAQGKDDNNIY